METILLKRYSFWVKKTLGRDIKLHWRRCMVVTVHVMAVTQQRCCCLTLRENADLLFQHPAMWGYLHIQQQRFALRSCWIFLSPSTLLLCKIVKWEALLSKKMEAKEGMVLDCLAVLRVSNESIDCSRNLSPRHSPSLSLIRVYNGHQPTWEEFPTTMADLCSMGLQEQYDNVNRAKDSGKGTFKDYSIQLHWRVNTTFTLQMWKSSS